MSSAAALAVDSGASPIAQLGYTPEQQTLEQRNTPISDAVPSNYQSLLGSQNDGQPFDARFEDATVQQGNAQADNAGKSISQQYDTNAADAMGGGIETDRAETETADTETAETETAETETADILILSLPILSWFSISLVKRTYGIMQ